MIIVYFLRGSIHLGMRKKYYYTTIDNDWVGQIDCDNTFYHINVDWLCKIIFSLLLLNIIKDAKLFGLMIVLKLLRARNKFTYY